jgi:sugar-specific transcriptional regulator TrmB
MLSTKQVITNLSEFGLSRYEAKLYFTLISEGVSTAKNLSDTTGIPYGKVYEIINSLIAKGYVVTLPTRPMKCKAISPKEAIASNRKKSLEKLEELERTMLIDLEPLFNKTRKFLEPQTGFWMSKGRSNINKTIETMICKAKKRICIFTSRNGLKRIGFFREFLEEAHRKNVEILIGGPIDKDNVSDIESLDFCDIRHIEDVPCHLFSIDESESILVEPIPDDDDLMYGRDIAVCISAPSFTKLLENSFYSYFSGAISLEKRMGGVR